VLLLIVQVVFAEIDLCCTNSLEKSISSAGILNCWKIAALISASVWSAVADVSIPVNLVFSASKNALVSASPS